LTVNRAPWTRPLGHRQLAIGHSPETRGAAKLSGNGFLGFPSKMALQKLLAHPSGFRYRPVRLLDCFRDKSQLCGMTCTNSDSEVRPPTGWSRSSSLSGDFIESSRARLVARIQTNQSPFSQQSD